jgi:ABC-2 type transport system permease protein
MRNLYAIYRKEMGHYFVSPIAYVVVGVFLILAAFFFNVILASVIQQSLAMEMQSMRYGVPQEFDVTGIVLRSFFQLVSTLVLFLMPMLTMGVYAEERKRGTMELLMTSPVKDIEIVLGKFSASLTLFVLMLLPTASYLVFIYFRSDPRPPWGLLLAGYGGVLLLGGALLAVGTFISSLTENQIIAAVLSFAAVLLLWVIDVGRSAGGNLGDILTYLSILRHYDDFTHGVVDTSSLIYYLSFMALFVFLTVRSLDSVRWRHA